MKGIENLMHYLYETKKYDMNALFTSLPSVKKTKKDKEICLKQGSKKLFHQFNLNRYSFTEVRKLIVHILGYSFPCL